MLVSHLSSFSYIDVDEATGTPFQAFSVVDNVVKKNEASMTSLKDAQQVVENGQVVGWGQGFELAENKNKVGLGFSSGSTRRDLKHIHEVFYSAGFIHSKDQFAAAILEDNQEQKVPNFVTHRLMCQNWIIVDVPSVIHLSK